MDSRPNELETAILLALASQEPALAPLVGQLQVATREFTGAGSYTTFAPINSTTPLQGPIVLDAHVDLPGPPNGLGAALWLTAGVPEQLEIFTIGTESWDGSYGSFVLRDAV